MADDGMKGRGRPRSPPLILQSCSITSSSKGRREDAVSAPSTRLSARLCSTMWHRMPKDLGKTKRILSTASSFVLLASSQDIECKRVMRTHCML